MPDSRIAKSAAVEVGKFLARNSSNSVNPGSPVQLGQLATARLTDVWKRRTRDSVGWNLRCLCLAAGIAERREVNQAPRLAHGQIFSNKGCA